MNLFYLAKILRGEIISSSEIRCPAPGMPPSDRSVTVTVEPDGWSVETDAGDAHRCADHVRGIMLEALKQGDAA